MVIMKEVGMAIVIMTYEDGDADECGGNDDSDDDNNWVSDNHNKDGDDDIEDSTGIYVLSLTGVFVYLLIIGENARVITDNDSARKTILYGRDILQRFRWYRAPQRHTLMLNSV